MSGTIYNKHFKAEGIALRLCFFQEFCFVNAQLSAINCAISPK